MNRSSNATNNTFSNDLSDIFLYDYCPLLSPEGLLMRAAKITGFVVIIATSLFGNLLVIIVTRRDQRLKKVAFTFVVNMAIADLLTTVINMPESLYEQIKDTDEWIAGHIGVVLCKILPFCQQVCSFCSALSLLAIASDRVFAICFPLRKLMTRKLSTIIIVSTWLIPSFFSAPMFLVNNVVKEKGIFFCVEEWSAPFDSLESPKYYTVILFVLFYILPLAIASVLYGCVIHKIWKRKIVGNHSSKTKRLLSRSRRKSLKIFITILVCFAFCWLPDHVAYFLIDDNEEFRDCGLPRDIYYVSLFFPHAISALNPCIYIIFNQGFRSGTKDLLIMCRRVLFRLNELVDSRNRSSCNDKMSWDEEKQSEIYPLHSLKTRRPPKMSTEYCKSYV